MVGYRGAVSMELLRTGWPEPLLTGRYSVVVSRWHDIGESVLDMVSLGLADPTAAVPEVRIAGRPAYRFVGRQHLVTAAAPAPVLHLRPVPRPPQPRRPWWMWWLTAVLFLGSDVATDVVDVRLGTVVGRAVVRWGFGVLVLPYRVDLSDAHGRPVGRLAERLTLTARLPWFGQRYRLTDAGGRTVARLRRPGRLLGSAVHVELCDPAAAVDPRLVLAVALLLG